MQKAGQKSFIKGAMILTAATMVVKVLGMLYKIPLGNILGAGGMSYFMSAYSIFNPVYALSVAGLPVAVSKMISESQARGRYREMRRIRRLSLLLFLCLGTLGTLVMLLGAGFFSRLIGGPAAAPAIAAMAPAIFFCCVMSAFRGYCQGLHDMTPTAASQVVESAAKLVFGILLATTLYNRGLAEYAASSTVFGTVARGEGQAQLLVLPYAAAGAVLGVTLSTAVGALYLLVRYLVRGDGINRRELDGSPPPRAARGILRGLIAIAVPVCLTAAVSHVSALIDVGTIMNRVAVAMERDSAAVLASYAGLLPADLSMEDLPSYLYGAFGFTTSLFNLVPAITVALGISALPAISADWAGGHRARARERIRSAVKLSALIAIPAGLGLCALAEPILALLYPSRVAEVAIAAPLLRRMGIAAALVGITTPMMSAFQAVGKTTVPVRLMLCGAALKAACNYLLLAVPSLNIGAAPLGTILCYGFILVAGLWTLHREVGVDLEVKKNLIKPLFCGIICAVAANTSYNLLQRLAQSRLNTLLSMAIACGFYAIFILFLKIITKNEAMMLPNGKKIVKILEKLRFLG